MTDCAKCKELEYELDYLLCRATGNLYSMSSKYTLDQMYEMVSDREQDLINEAVVDERALKDKVTSALGIIQDMKHQLVLSSYDGVIRQDLLQSLIAKIEKVKSVLYL